MKDKFEVLPRNNFGCISSIKYKCMYTPDTDVSWSFDYYCLNKMSTGLIWQDIVDPVKDVIEYAK